jgi:hypothetical protein
MLPKTNSMKSLKRTRVDSEEKNETKEEAAKSSKSSFAQALSKVLSRPVNVSTKVSDDMTSSSLTLSKPSGNLVAKKSSSGGVLAKRHTALQKLQEKEAAAAAISRQRKKELRNRRQAINVDPKHSPPDFERMLRKVATKGVVALFNAIAQHQKVVDSIADKEGVGDKIAASKRPGSIVKAVAAQQSSFLDLLRTSTQKEASKKNEESTVSKMKPNSSGDLFKSRRSKQEEEEELEYEDDDGDDEAEF